MKTRSYLLITIAAIFLTLTAGCANNPLALLNQPQGPAINLTLTPQAPIPTFTQIVASSPTPPPLPTSTPTPVPTLQAAPASSSACNSSGSMVILVTGYDQTIEAPFGADFIRYIKADFDQPSVSIVAIPRDIWLQTSMLQPQYIYQSTLGRLFFYSYRGAPGQPPDKLLTATTALTQTLYDAFEVVPDHYVTVNLSSFAQLVDAVGGVNVTIPQDLVGSSYYFRAGDQLLNGNSALLYVRALPRYSSEWDRNQRQNLVLRALGGKIFSPFILPKVPDLIKIYRQNLVTDLSIEQFLNLACLVNQVSLDNISYSSISPDMVSVGPRGSMLPDIEIIKAFLKQQLDGK